MIRGFYARGRSPLLQMGSLGARRHVCIKFPRKSPSSLAKIIKEERYDDLVSVCSAVNYGPALFGDPLSSASLPEHMFRQVNIDNLYEHPTVQDLAKELSSELLTWSKAPLHCCVICIKRSLELYEISLEKMHAPEKLCKEAVDRLVDIFTESINLILRYDTKERIVRSSHGSIHKINEISPVQALEILEDLTTKHNGRVWKAILAIATTNYKIHAPTPRLGNVQIEKIWTFLQKAQQELHEGAIKNPETTSGIPIQPGITTTLGSLKSETNLKNSIEFLERIPKDFLHGLDLDSLVSSIVDSGKCDYARRLLNASDKKKWIESISTSLQKCCEKLSLTKVRDARDSLEVVQKIKTVHNIAQIVASKLNNEPKGCKKTEDIKNTENICKNTENMCKETENMCKEIENICKETEDICFLHALLLYAQIKGASEEPKKCLGENNKSFVLEEFRKTLLAPRIKAVMNSKFSSCARPLVSFYFPKFDLDEFGTQSSEWKTIYEQDVTHIDDIDSAVKFQECVAECSEAFVDIACYENLVPVVCIAFRNNKKMSIFFLKNPHLSPHLALPVLGHLMSRNKIVKVLLNFKQKHKMIEEILSLVPYDKPSMVVDLAHKYPKGDMKKFIAFVYDYVTSLNIGVSLNETTDTVVLKSKKDALNRLHVNSIICLECYFSLRGTLALETSSQKVILPLLEEIPICDILEPTRLKYKHVSSLKSNFKNKTQNPYSAILSNRGARDVDRG